MDLSRVSPTPIIARQGARVNAVARYVVTVVCAASAGIHAALVRPHLEEAGLRLGVAFAAAAVALAFLALAVRRPRHDSWAPSAAVAVLGLIALAYLLSRTATIPHLIAEREGFDPLGVLTSSAELAGALAGVILALRKDSA